MTDWHHPHEVEDLNAVGGHCPRCRAEYRPGFTMCSDCNVPLVPGPAPSEETAPPDVPRDWWDRPAGSEVEPEHLSADRVTEPAEIAELPYQEAWLLAGRLRSDGIPATVFPPAPVSPYGVVLTRLFSVLVPKELAEEARQAARPFLPGAESDDG